MGKELFEQVLYHDEDVIWCGGINKSAFVMRSFFKTFLFGLFPPVAILMLGTPYGWLVLILSLFKIIPLWIGIAFFSFSVIAWLIFILCIYRAAKNTYFCITDKRVLKRSGAFNNKYEHYSLKNVGTITVSGGFFDRKKNMPSATLTVLVKDFYADSRQITQFISVDNLNDAYEASKILSSMVEGNQDNLKIKIEE
ncbi:MAG: PH domain-containing protein [Erysipelotrichaceae bacterium]|nr:PH domain-containing protein [Erysipelotrichaceae bacterium]